jgi:hypothetical protein
MCSRSPTAERSVASAASQRFGKIIKALLVHEVQAAVNRDQLCHRLANYVPAAFAKAVCESQTHAMITLKNFFVMACELPAQTLDQVYTLKLQTELFNYRTHSI